jgi:hypothetical protein
MEYTDKVALMEPPKLPVIIETASLDIHQPDDPWMPAGQPGRSWLSRLVPWRTTVPSLIEQIGWANPDPADVDRSALAGFRVEWDSVDTSCWTEDEWQFESPSAWRHTGDLSQSARATFARLIEHRRAIAATRDAVCLPNRQATDDALCAGYSLVHVATGITASFYVNSSGRGTVFAKSYSNPFLPAGLPDRTPSQFYGYGVGRRLYLASHALWPQLRWDDNALRSTSHDLRQALHEIDPFTWQDKKCLSCRRPNGWHEQSRPELERRHA